MVKKIFHMVLLQNVVKNMRLLSARVLVSVHEKLFSRDYDESKHLQKITDIFCEEWQLLNFGPTIMSEYIHFCEYKQEFPPAFFKSVNLTIRSALKTIVC